jgi:hypothetical protein
MDVSDWPGWDEHRRGVAACLISSRHEDTGGHARVEVHVAVERRAEAVQEGDATEPRAGGSRYLGIRGSAWPNPVRLDRLVPSAKGRPQAAVTAARWIFDLSRLIIMAKAG